MPRSQLLKGIRPDRERLRWLREFFDWLYAEQRSAGELALRFWSLWSSLHGRELSPRKRAVWQRLISNAPTSAFLAMQCHLREWVAGLPRLFAQGETIRLKVGDRFFGAMPDIDGRWYFGFAEDLVPPRDIGDLMDRADTDLMQQLGGLSVEVLGQCGRCGRVFLRLRARRRLYCSARCKYEAAPSTRRLRAKQRSARGRRSAAGAAAG